MFPQGSFQILKYLMSWKQRNVFYRVWLRTVYQWWWLKPATTFLPRINHNLKVTFLSATLSLCYIRFSNSHRLCSTFWNLLLIKRIIYLVNLICNVVGYHLIPKVSSKGAWNLLEFDNLELLDYFCSLTNVIYNTRVAILGFGSYS